ncbi:hypothetical protein PR048_020278 [Dryococelus australis]|uniref:Uncharacterized protein n=1 Tax=Dryococelus australis TaxID=614101 RepID=A0ABQ9H5Z4_9NEOP|nr:hypothetical protein PR048_020278 [Dryococelus australis]
MSATETCRCKCGVCGLRVKHFSSIAFTFQERCDIIKEGRPTPELTITTTRKKGTSLGSSHTCDQHGLATQVLQQPSGKELIECSESHVCDDQRQQHQRYVRRRVPHYQDWLLECSDSPTLAGIARTCVLPTGRRRHQETSALLVVSCKLIWQTMTAAVLRICQVWNRRQPNSLGRSVWGGGGRMITISEERRMMSGGGVGQQVACLLLVDDNWLSYDRPEAVCQWTIVASRNPLMMLACLGYSWTGIMQMHEDLWYHAVIVQFHHQLPSEVVQWYTFGLAFRRTRAGSSKPVGHCCHLWPADGACMLGVQLATQNQAAYGQIVFGYMKCVRTVVQWFRLFASHQDEPGSIPGGFAPRFSRVGIMPDDAAGGWVSLGISCFPNPFILALLHNYMSPPSLAVKTSISRRDRLSDIQEANGHYINDYEDSHMLCMMIMDCTATSNTLAQEFRHTLMTTTAHESPVAAMVHGMSGLNRHMSCHSLLRWIALVRAVSRWSHTCLVAPWRTPCRVRIMLCHSWPYTGSYGMRCHRSPIPLAPSPHRQYTDQQPSHRRDVGTCCCLYLQASLGLCTNRTTRDFMWHTSSNSYWMTIMDIVPTLTLESAGSALAISVSNSQFKQFTNRLEPSDTLTTITLDVPVLLSFIIHSKQPCTHTMPHSLFLSELCVCTYPVTPNNTSVPNSSLECRPHSLVTSFGGKNMSRSLHIDDFLCRTAQSRRMTGHPLLEIRKIPNYHMYKQLPGLGDHLRSKWNHLAFEPSPQPATSALKPMPAPIFIHANIPS